MAVAVKVTGVPAQITLPGLEVIVTVGTSDGFTVTVTVVEVPLHPFEEGVMV